MKIIYHFIVAKRTKVIRKIYGFLLFICFCFVFFGCADKPKTFKTNEIYKPTNLNLPSQDLLAYKSNSFFISKETSQKLKNHYLDMVFSIWNDEVLKQDLGWLEQLVLKSPGYGENLKPNSKELMNKLVLNADFKSLSSVEQNAILIHSSDLRLLPTSKPRYLNPNLAGEGYPFDYLQNSYLYAYTPVKISHFSLDKSWVFVKTSFVSGFIKTKNIAKIHPKTAKKLRQSKDYVMPKKDYIPLYDENGDFLEYARVGMLLAVDDKSPKNGDFYHILAYKKDLDGYAKLVKTKVKKVDFIKLGDEYSSDDLLMVANELLGEKYGWGGMGGNRDCSMFLRDIFGSFGVFLERNSKAQIYQKDYENKSNFYDLSDLSDKQKMEFISANAKPFATLLALDGHIVLYIGKDSSGKMMILHDVWGIKSHKNGREGRVLVGGVSITPIDFGKDIKDVLPKDTIIRKINSMRNIF